MTPTSPELAAWLEHISGQKKQEMLFERESWFSQLASVRARRGQYGEERIIKYSVPPDPSLLYSLRILKETFGQNEFDAAICFIDMVGFTERAKGRPPKEVCGIVTPFLLTVIATATQNKCFVDKTIGDEVMVVMPVFPQVKHPLTDMAWFLFGVVERMEAKAPATQFRAGIA